MILLAVAAGAIVAAVIALARPRLPDLVPAAVVPVSCLCGAVGMAVSSAAPTGWSVLDVILRVALGALVPLAAARARTGLTVWLCLVGFVVVVITEPTAAVVGGVAAGTGLSLATSGSFTAPLRAAVAAAVLFPLGLVDWPLASGLSALAVAVAVVPLLVGGLVRAPAPWRRRALAGVAVVVVVLGVGALAGLAAAFSADDDVERAVQAATRGLDRLGDEGDAAQEDLGDAAAAFGDAESTMRSWWARPALLVPVVAQQSRAVSTMASAGRELATTAADAATDADVDSIRPRDGTIDLAALEDLAEPLERSLRTLERTAERLADIRSPLLLPPVAERLESLGDEVDGALGSASLASQAVDAAPGLLGADGPRRYFVSVQNPAEITGNGGFMGNWAEIEARDGRLRLSRSGRVRELLDAGASGTIDDVPEWTDTWGQYAGSSWGVFAFSPDNPTVSRVVAERYPESGGSPVDGVITLTPEAFAAFLDLTGPIEVPGYPQSLSEDNAERILTHEQYLDFPREDALQREQFLEDATNELFDQVLAGELPGPRGIAATLGPAVESRALQLWAADPAEQALFDRIGATGSIERDGTDSFGVVTQNFNGSKIDWFTRRSIDYEATWDPDSGAVDATLTATIRNEAPTTGFPASIIGWGGDVSLGQRPVADGENFMDVTVYAALPIESVTVEGQPVDLRAAGRSHGHHFASFYLSVPSESSRVVVAELAGTVTPGRAYEVRAVRQPTIEPDELSAVIRVDGDWTASSETATTGNDTTAGSTTVRRDQSAATPFALRVVVDRPRSATNLLEWLRSGGR